MAQQASSLGQGTVLRVPKSGPAGYLFLAVSFIGTVLLVRLLAHFLTGAFKAFIRPGKNLKKYGEYALVTGATDGIGKASAYQLAKQGMKLILVARDEGKLDEMIKEMQEDYPSTEIKKVALDFANQDHKGWEALQREIDSVDLGLLLHCAGASYPHALYLYETENSLHNTLVQVNCMATTKIVKMAMKKMVQGQNRGAIVTVGSGAGTILPSDPLYATYAGSKAFVEKLTKSIAIECSDSNVHVQLQVPMFVATKMSKIRKPRIDAPSPEAYAKASIRHIGYESVVTPWWSHKIMWFLADVLSPPVLEAFRLKQSSKIREKALKKKGAEQQAPSSKED